MAIPIFSKISLDTNDLDKGLTRTKRKLGAMKKSIMGVGSAFGLAFGGQAIIGAFKKWATELDRIGKLSARLGLSAESLQRVGHAADLAGADVETFQKALTKAIRSGQDAEDGLTTAIRAFDDLGISVDAFNAAASEEKLAMIADGIANTADEGKALAAAIAIMGRGGAESFNLLMEGGDALRETMASAKVATNEAVDAAQELNDQFTILKNQMAPAAGEAVSWANNWIKGIRAVSAEVEAATKKFTTHESKHAEIEAEKARKILGLATGISLPSAASADTTSTKGNRLPQSLHGKNVTLAGEEYGPATSGVAAGMQRGMAHGKIMDFIGFVSAMEEKINAGRGRAFDSSQNALDAGIAASRDKLAGMSPMQTVADSLASIGGGGSAVSMVNPQYRLQQQNQQILKAQKTLLDKIEGNTGKDKAMQ